MPDTAIMPLQLSVPSQGADVKVETRPDHIRQWLDTLSQGNIGETSRALASSLIALNRARIGAENRLLLLELYRNAVANLLPTLKAHFVIVPLPLPEKNRLLAEVTRQIYLELAIGYKILLLEAEARKPGTAEPLWMQRALSGLGLGLATCYEMYTPVPAGLWAEIHAIHRYAEKLGIHEAAVRDGTVVSSVALAYQQILLLAVADPYHLMQGDVIRILDYVSRFGVIARLRPAQVPGSGNAGLFLAAPDADAPPKALDGKMTVPEGGHLLDTADLAQLLSQQVARLEGGESPAEMQLPDTARDPAYRNLLNRLLKHWGISAKRHYNRKRFSAEVEVCVGIRALHYFLNGEKPHDAPSVAVPATDSAELDFCEHKSAVKQPASEFCFTRWSVVNESAGGMAITQASSIPPQIRAGEVIGLRSESGKHWHVAVVRWVKSDNVGHLDLGIQLLAPRAEAVTIKPAAASAAAAHQIALLLPEVSRIRQPAAILTTRGNFQTEREFLLEQGGEAAHVRAAELVETTAAFDQFRFSNC